MTRRRRALVPNTDGWPKRALVAAIVAVAVAVVSLPWALRTEPPTYVCTPHPMGQALVCEPMAGGR